MTIITTKLNFKVTEQLRNCNCNTEVVKIVIAFAKALLFVQVVIHVKQTSNHQVAPIPNDELPQIHQVESDQSDIPKLRTYTVKWSSGVDTGLQELKNKIRRIS